MGDGGCLLLHRWSGKGSRTKHVFDGDDDCLRKQRGWDTQSAHVGIK